MRTGCFGLLLLVQIVSPFLIDPMASAQPIFKQASTCADSTFEFQANFWVNLHFFLRAESRRRRLDAPQQMSGIALTPAEVSAWKTSLDAYDAIAQVSPLFDEKLISFANRLAQESEVGALPPISGEESLVDALNRAAPIYRAHRWPDDQKQDAMWITANCANIQQHDDEARRAIAAVFHIKAPTSSILVDVAAETGPTLAFTTAGPPGRSGHTTVAPQKNSVQIVALDTIYHEISHTMVDDSLIEAINQRASRQNLKVPDDLWHAMTLYSTEEITKRVIHADRSTADSLDTNRAQMFERNGWRGILVMLKRDWQPYLDGNVDYDTALSNLVRDTAK